MPRKLTLYFTKNEEAIGEYIRRLAERCGLSINDILKLLIARGLQSLQDKDYLELKLIGLQLELQYLIRQESIVYRARKSLLRSHEKAYLHQDMNSDEYGQKINRQQRKELLPREVRRAVDILDETRDYWAKRIQNLTRKIEKTLRQLKKEE